MGVCVHRLDRGLRFDSAVPVSIDRWPIVRGTYRTPLAAVRSFIGIIRRTIAMGRFVRLRRGHCRSDRASADHRSLLRVYGTLAGVIRGRSYRFEVLSTYDRLPDRRADSEIVWVRFRVANEPDEATIDHS